MLILLLDICFCIFQTGDFHKFLTCYFVVPSFDSKNLSALSQSVYPLDVCIIILKLSLRSFIYTTSKKLLIFACLITECKRSRAVQIPLQA
jgi:hypothetical protein